MPIPHKAESYDDIRGWPAGLLGHVCKTGRLFLHYAAPAWGRPFREISLPVCVIYIFPCGERFGVAGGFGHSGGFLKNKSAPGCNPPPPGGYIIPGVILYAGMRGAWLRAAWLPHRGRRGRGMNAFRIYIATFADNKTHIDMSAKQHNCASCPIRARHDKAPRSPVGRFWRWHIGFCPGWKKYFASLGDAERNELRLKYRLK